MMSYFVMMTSQVFGTPNAAKLLSILRKMLLIERDTPTGDIIWNGLETMTESALKIYSEQQSHRVVSSGNNNYSETSLIRTHLKRNTS